MRDRRSAPVSRVDRAGRSALAVAVVIALGLACAEELPPVEPPAPSLEGSEPLVAQRIRAATDAVREEPGSAVAWGELGEVLDVHGFEDPAIFCYEQARRLDPGDWRWPYFAAIVLRASDPAAAHTLLSAAAALEPGYVPIHIYMGLGRFLDEDLAEAERHYRHALTLEGDHANALIGLARIDVARGDPSAALAHLRRAAKESSEEGAVHVHLAQVYRELGRHADAEHEERLAASSGRPARADGMATLADPVRDEVTMLRGVSSDWQLVKSRRLLRQGRRQAALEAVELALEADPESFDALLISGRLLADSGKLDEARRRIERALELHDTSPEALVELGNVRARSGGFTLAVAAYERALEIDPDLPEVRGNLGFLLIETGRPEEGIARLREASAALPQNADLRYNLAAALVASGRPAEVVELLNEALSLRPGDTEARYLLGSVHADAGRLEEAVAAFERVVQADPRHTEAQTSLGRALWRLERYEGAVAAFRAALSTAAAENPEPARDLAWALATCPRDDLRDGRLATRLALTLSRQSQFGNARNLDVLAAALAETGDYAGAVESARRSLAILERGIEALQAPDETDQRLDLERRARDVRARLTLYRQGQAYRDRP
jgi:tetratricopeptide (TPR) repeat protein